MIRSYHPSDDAMLTAWGRKFFGPEFKLPFGWQYAQNGKLLVETAIQSSSQRPVAALTVSKSFYAGPLVHNPDSSRFAIARSVVAFDKEMREAAGGEIADVYLAAPAGMPAWHNTLRKLGYQDMPESLRWFWKALQPMAMK